MALIWDQSLEINIPDIDGHHKRIVDYIQNDDQDDSGNYAIISIKPPT